MPLLSFNKVKLFKGGEIQPRKPAAAEPQEEAEELPPLERFVRSPWFALGVTAVVVALFLSYRPVRSLPQLKLGEIASADIVAPYNLTVEDKEATNVRRAEAENAVVPVYTYDPNVFANTEDKLRRLFAAGRNWIQKNPTEQKTAELRATLLDTLGVDLDAADMVTLVRLRFPAELEEVLARGIRKFFVQGIILSKNLFVHGELERGLSLLDLQDGERTVKAEEILDLKEAEERFGAEVGKLEIPERSKELLKSLAQIFLTPDLTYNKIETENRKALARAGVPPTTVTVKKGRVIIRKGDEATTDVLRMLDLYNQRTQRQASWLPDFAGSLLLYVLLLAALWRYLSYLQKKDKAESSFRMIGFFLIVSLVLYKISLALAASMATSLSTPAFTRIDTYYYAIPLQVGALVIAFLAADQAAVGFTVINALTVGYLLGGNFYLMVYGLVGGLAAILGLRMFKKSQRMGALKAGFLVLPPVNVALVLIFHLLEKQGGAGIIAADAFMGIVCGVLSASIAFLLIPSVETAFGFITASKLLELMNSDLPVFKQMSMEAPGTYHHSLLVATLAEKAAEELGLNSQLARAGGLYHDIGKTKMPEYFIENRERENDVHKGLMPSMSTLVIINHVKEGGEIARKMKLPRPLREIIEQHHGNSLVRYFYQKAKQVYNPEEQKVGEEDYRYPGPQPQTKEAALVMLADSVEAASRSLRHPTKDSLKRVITDIFNAYLQDGQLDACDFSLRQLRDVASAFMTILYAIYHPRVEYPGFEFEAKKGRRPVSSAAKGEMPAANGGGAKNGKNGGKAGNGGQPGATGGAQGAQGDGRGAESSDAESDADMQDAETDVDTGSGEADKNAGPPSPASQDGKKPGP